jgi:hypothetical protein
MKGSEMKKQRGNSTITLIIVVVIAVMALATFMNYANYGNRTEVALDAKKESNKNILGQYGQKVQEMGQIPAMARDDITKIVQAAIQGRYGSNGSQAAIQMIREQNPTVDPSLYRKIMQVIEAGRSDYEQGQKQQIDMVRSYRTALGNMPGSFFLSLAGYPKKPLNTWDIITTGRANDVYNKGYEDAPIQIAPKH